MTLRIGEISLDCADPEALAAFWGGALGYRVTGRDEQSVQISGDDTAPTILFQRTDDPKLGKNRWHLDLCPVTPSERDAEVERLLRLGARHIDIGQDPTSRWVVLADPEGNELCVMSTVLPPEPQPFPHGD
jgi:catechol 2,3-dioxygenase-like lactoylglutathione lyase family enzyme